MRNLMNFMWQKIPKAIAQHYVIPVLKGTSTFLTGTLADHHFHMVSLYIYIFLHYLCMFVIYTIMFLVRSLKPRVPSDPQEAFITILKKMPEMVHVFAVGIHKQSE